MLKPEQISEYSIVQGNRNGDAFCINDPIMFVRRHSTIISDAVALFVILCSWVSGSDTEK